MSVWGERSEPLGRAKHAPGECSEPERERVGPEGASSGGDVLPCQVPGASKWAENAVVSAKIETSENSQKSSNFGVEAGRVGAKIRDIACKWRRMDPLGVDSATPLKSELDLLRTLRICAFFGFL